MAENRTLLSQSEIDALVNFLQQGGTTEASSIGDVLDQSSIDKLVDIIRFNNTNGIFLSSSTNASAIGAGNADITTPDGSKLDKAQCELRFRLSDSGMAEVYCFYKPDGASYVISPDSLKKQQYVAEGSEWGFAISPRHFNKVANLFRIAYAQETYSAVVDRFREVMYGNASAVPSGIYFPVED